MSSLTFACLCICVFRVTETPVTATSPSRPKRWVDVSSKHDVFLGGSCNPTTWRCDTAIPYLQKCGLTYYNPQVDHWYPELIEIEEQAKTAATVLLFVVDKETRALSSMVEIGYLTGRPHPSLDYATPT